MDRYLRRRTVTFVVRVWAEYLAQTPPQCRGEVEQVGSGERACFRDLAGVTRFIERQAARASDADGECTTGEGDE